MSEALDDCMKREGHSGSLRERIASGSAAIGILGMGYVGLTEAVALARAGFRVTGFDVDATRVRDVQAGRSYLVDVADHDLAQLVESGKLCATDDFTRLGDMDAALICVPTPLSKTKAPDLSYVVAAIGSIRETLREGQLVVLESTTYPGTTSELVLPALQATGLKVGVDFHLCFSPERVNPGDKTHSPGQIPRIVGGVTPACAEVAGDLYSKISSRVVVVSSPEAAEMVKLLENTFRAVNIALVNEIALMCRSFAIDVWEIVDAAATKPFGFMPFYPGPGLGGHCIPVDPLYLSWKAKLNGFEPRFIDLAHQVNSQMPRFVVSVVMDVLNGRRRSLNGSTILVLGVTYKRDVNDIRESPALEIIGHLLERGAKVVYHDPYVPTLDVEGHRLNSVSLDRESLTRADCVLILTDHACVDYRRVVELATVVVDTRHACRQVGGDRHKVVTL